MSPELAQLRTKLQGSYGELLSETEESLTDGSDPYLAAQSAFQDVISYGATFGDRSFVLKVFAPLRELFQRALAKPSKHDLKNDITLNRRTSQKHFGLFVTSNAIEHGDEPANFEHFDASLRPLVDAIQPEADELGGAYGSAVVVEATAMWALATLWKRPHDFALVAAPLKSVKLAAAFRPVRDALVEFVEGGGDPALAKLDAALAKVVSPKKYDAGNLGPLLMTQAYILSLLRWRGNLLEACTRMYG